MSETSIPPQDQAVEIIPVRNGFLLSFTTSRHRDNGYARPSLDDSFVFQTLAELTGYLSRHFTHREDDVSLDRAGRTRTKK